MSARMAILGVVAAAAVGAACRDVPPPPLRVGAVLFPGCELLRLAEVKGHFGDVPLQLIDYRSPSDLTRDFRNGVLDAAAVTLDQLLEPADRTRRHHVVLVMDFSEGADAVVARSSVADVAALSGKRLGVSGDALGALMMTRALEAGRVPAKDVSVVRVDVAEQEKAFADGRVDAVVTYEPMRSRLVAAGGHEIFSSAQISGEIVDVMVAGGDVVEKRGESLRALVEGWFRAREEMKRDPPGSARVLAPREGMTSEEFLAALSGLRFPSREENRRLLAANRPALAPSLEKLRGALQGRGLVRPGVPAADVTFDGRFVAPGAP